MAETRLVPGGQVREFDAQEGRLQPVQSRVDALDDVVILRALTVVTVAACSLDDGGIARRDHPAVAVRAEVLGWIEAEAGELAERTARAPVVPRSVGLGGVLHDREASARREFEQRRHLCSLAGEMHRQQRSSSRRDSRSDGIWVDVVRRRITINQYDVCAYLADREGGCDVCVRGNNHLVSRADLERQEAEA